MCNLAAFSNMSMGRYEKAALEPTILYTMGYEPR